MGVFALAVVCLHMLSWSACCHSASELHMLGSHGNLLRQEIDSIQIHRSSWRKLLEGSAVGENARGEENANAGVTAESKLVDETDASSHAAEKRDMEDVQKDSVSSNEHGKIEEVKPHAAPLTPQIGEGRREGADDKDMASASKSHENRGENMSAIDHSDNWRAQSDADESEHRLTATHNTSNRVAEPESNVNQEAVKEESREGETLMLAKDKVEVLKTESAVIEQVQTDANSTSVAISDFTKSETGERLVAAIDQEHSNNATGQKVESAQTLNASSTNADLSDKIESKIALPTSSSKGNSSTALVESETQLHAQINENPTRSVKEESVDEYEDEKRFSKENNDLKEQLTEQNPTKTVSDSGTEKVALASTQPVAVNDKDKNEFAIEKTIDKLDASEGDSFQKENNSQEHADDKIEEKIDVTESLVEKEQKSEDAEKIASHVQDEWKVKETEHIDYESSIKSTESSNTDSSDTKAIENEVLRDGSTENRVDDDVAESDGNDFSVATKTDDETEAARKEVESQLEALKRDTVIETSVDQMHEIDPSEDEYDIIQELADLPTKFQETAGKVADRLRPGVIKWTDTSKVYFNRANQHMTESFSPLFGTQYAPFVSSMISYAILLLPLIVVILLFDHIKALFSLQKVLLFINIYLAAYFATLWLASFMIGLEPMSFFYLNSLSSFLSLQLLQGLGYMIYLILQTANIIHSCTSDAFASKVTSTLQWTVAVSIGLHYYVTIFHPAIASKPPRTSWKFYAIYASAFFVLCLFARIRWIKKQYITSGSNVGDKKS